MIVVLLLVLLLTLTACDGNADTSNDMGGSESSTPSETVTDPNEESTNENDSQGNVPSVDLPKVEF